MEHGSPQSSRNRGGIGQTLVSKFVLKGRTVQSGVADRCVRKDEVPLRIKRRCRMPASTREISFCRTSSIGGGKFFVVVGLRKWSQESLDAKFASITVSGGALGYWSFYCSQEFVHHSNSFKGNRFRGLVAGAGLEPL